MPTGTQFNNIAYSSDIWSEYGNSKKDRWYDIHLTFPSPNQVTILEGSRLQGAKNNVYWNSNETISLPTSSAEQTYTFYVERDNDAKTFTTHFTTGSVSDGDLTTIYNIPFAEYQHLGGTTYLEDNVTIFRGDFESRVTNQAETGGDINSYSGNAGLQFAKGVLEINKRFDQVGISIYGINQLHTPIISNYLENYLGFNDALMIFHHADVLSGGGLLEIAENNTSNIRKFKTDNFGIIPSDPEDLVDSEDYLRFETNFQSVKTKSIKIADVLLSGAGTITLDYPADDFMYLEIFANNGSTIINPIGDFRTIAGVIVGTSQNIMTIEGTISGSTIEIADNRQIGHVANSDHGALADGVITSVFGYYQSYGI